MDFSPLLVIFSALIAAALPIGLLLAYAGQLGRIVPFIKRFLPVLLFVGLFFNPFVPLAVLGADGTTGSIDFDQDSVTEGTLLYIELEGLTAGADYLVNWTTDDTGYSFTTGASQTDMTVPVKVDMPASGSVFVVYLRYQSAGTQIDAVTFIVTEAETILDTDAFLAIAIPLLVMTLIVGIILGISRGQRKRMRRKK